MMGKNLFLLKRGLPASSSSRAIDDCHVFLSPSDRMYVCIYIYSSILSTSFHLFSRWCLPQFFPVQFEILTVRVPTRNPSSVILWNDIPDLAFSSFSHSTRKWGKCRIQFRDKERGKKRKVKLFVIYPPRSDGRWIRKHRRSGRVQCNGHRSNKAQCKLLQHGIGNVEIVCQVNIQINKYTTTIFAGFSGVSRTADAFLPNAGSTILTRIRTRVGRRRTSIYHVTNKVTIPYKAHLSCWK